MKTLTEKINLTDILKEEYNKDFSLISESYSSFGNRIPHLYQDYDMTFREMKQIFEDIFSGKTVLTEKLEGLNVFVTYKDGDFYFARNKSTMKDPIKLSHLEGCYEGNGGGLVREAYVRSAKDLTTALNSIGKDNLERVFENGQNFANILIVYPPCENILDYGKRCLLQLNGVESYDSNFNVISKDEDSSKWLYETLKAHKALKQEMFEIEEPRMVRMRDSISAEKALGELLEDFNNVIDGFSTKCSIRDYANERMRRYIINSCNHNNIEVERDCPFVRELADRIGRFSHRRPTKADICTFAKRAGVDVRSEDYKNMMTEIESRQDEINEEIMRPVENLVMKAGVYLLKNLRGYMASDPNKCSQKLSETLENVITEVERDKSRLTPEKLKLYRRHMKKLEDWKNKVCPSSGVYFKHNNKTYKVLGAFGNIRQILRIFGDK